MRHRQTFLSSFQSFVVVCSPVNHLFKPLSPVTLNHADPGPVSLLILSLGFLLNGYSNILTVVALFSKTTHFIPMPSRANAKETNHNATVFLFYLPPSLIVQLIDIDPGPRFWKPFADFWFPPLFIALIYPTLPLGVNIKLTTIILLHGAAVQDRHFGCLD